MSHTIRDALEALLSMVPTGTTEGERAILREGFVQIDNYAEIITPPPGSPRLLVGKKGSGKSAIIDFSMTLLKEIQVPAIVLKPIDIVMDGFQSTASSAELTRAAYKSLLNSVGAKIGSDLSGMLIGESKTLYEQAVMQGEREPDLIGRLARSLASATSKITRLDLTKLLPSSAGHQRKLLETSIEKSIEGTAGAFYVFVDDTDQVGSPGVAGHLNRVWAVILAARELSSQVNQLRVVISLRDEVWRALQADENGQRDQLDHFWRLVHNINPSLDNVQEIFERRLALAAGKILNVQPSGPLYEIFFDGDRPLMPSSQVRSSWPDIIRTRSRERPRDAIQLLNMLATAARNQTPSTRITDGLLAKVMPVYSKERAKLLAQEFEKECPSLAEILKSFSRIQFDQGSFNASCDRVREHLRTLPSAFSIKLVGTALHPGDDDDVYKLWAFLYSIGFFYPRVTDSRQPGGYRFITPAEQATFVHKSRWNEMQKATWEIHPSYRDYLIALQEDAGAQFGIPTKPSPRRFR